MAWVSRNGSEYFYLSQRQGDRVRKIYVGMGDVGRAAELVLAARKEQKDQVRDWLRWAAVAFTEVDLIDARLEVELAAVLQARVRIQLDCRHARAILRKQKGKIMEGFEDNILSAADQTTWQQLSLRASRGDREAATALIPLLDSHPELVARWGDLSRVALNRWLTIVGTDELVRNAIHKQMLDLVRSVRQLDDDPLEETMARRIGILWLQVTYFDSQVASATNRTPAEQTFLAKRQNDAQNLYANATKALREYQGTHQAKFKCIPR